MFGLIVLHQFISNQLIANDKKFYFLHTELCAFKIFEYKSIICQHLDWKSPIH